MLFGVWSFLCVVRCLWLFVGLCFMWFHVARCSLFVVCCGTCVVRCCLFVFLWLPFVVCSWLFVVAVYCVWLCAVVVCCLLFMVCL